VALAGRQHGVITLAQLRSLGLSPSGVRTRIASGRLHRVHCGVYALGRPALSTEGRWLAAVMACGPDAILSHRSAAALHGVMPTAQTRIDVTVPRRASLSRPEIRVHRSISLSDADRTIVCAVPCTSVPRTLLDLAGALDRDSLGRACDQAEVLRLLDWSAMDVVLSRARSRAGVRKVRAIRRAGGVGDDIPRSELEERFLALCRHARLPQPAVNAWITVAGEAMEVDFAWHEQRVMVETDGFRTHGTRRAFQRDRRRDQLLTLAGWQVIRFTWDEVTKQPRHVMEVARELLSGAAK
jgi:very-short-patch-repair endonuclease